MRKISRRHRKNLESKGGLGGGNFDRVENRV